MADETQNAATQVSSGITAMLAGLWSAFATAAGSWRGLIALALILGFILVYQGRLTPQQFASTVKPDNSEVLTSVANIRKDIADLKALLARQRTPSVANNYPSAIDPPRP